MTLDEILQDKELAILKKKSAIHKSDFSNVLYDSAAKAFGFGIDLVEVLVYDAVIKRERNEFMFNQYKNGYVLNHSVGMRYVKLFFCYNSEEPEYSAEKENFDKYYPLIMNKGSESITHFWAITEAKNIEGSAVVKGSNFLTPVLSVENIDENTIRVKCAISPANIIDSHEDVHIAGLWNKSIKETTYNLLLQEHEMEFSNVIVDSISGDLKVYTEMISVKELMARFKSNKSIEPSLDTQIEEPTRVTQFNVAKAIEELKFKL